MALQKQYIINVDTTQPDGQAVQIFDSSAVPVSTSGALPLFQGDSFGDAAADLDRVVDAAFVTAVRG